MKAFQRPEYLKMIEELKNLRLSKKLTQFELAALLGPDYDKSVVNKVERRVRRLDFIELIDYAKALDIPFLPLVKKLLKAIQVDESSNP